MARQSETEHAIAVDDIDPPLAADCPVFRLAELVALGDNANATRRAFAAKTSERAK